MAKFNFEEDELEQLRDKLKQMLPPEAQEDFKKLCDGVELGLRSHRVIRSIRPLVSAVWVSMSEKQDPNRFAVERMVKDIDDVLCYWVVPDNREGEEPESVE
jgi:hypothetical protein